MMFNQHRFKLSLALCILGSVSGFQLAHRVSPRGLLSAPQLPRSVVLARLKQDATFGSNELQQPKQSIFKSLTKHETSWSKRRFAIRKAFTKFTSLFHRRTVAFCFAALLWLSVSQAAFAVTGGRVGGSFGRSSSSSQYSAPGRVQMRPSQMYYGNEYYKYGAPPYSLSAPRLTLDSPRPRVRPDGASRFTTSDVVVLTGSTAVIGYGLLNNYKGKGSDGTISPLGPGATVASIVVSLDVANQDDPNSIVQRLKKISSAASTSTRRGVQNLVTEVCLELSRQERSMVSATTETKHFGAISSAEREFRHLSVQSRSKFDRESVNKFGNMDRSDDQSPGSANVGPRATSAIVSINVAIEGDSTKLPRIRDRKDVLSALSKLASDAQVEECLLSAEILWAPDAPGEILTTNDVYADYPSLVPL
ncbi:hypothetical protein MPSEU_000864500 [Mayamaea pseudoterrestris]|nr:hypothetical protein MPSEU_000864500 [Mayamaea pseudoterrestris]